MKERALIRLLLDTFTALELRLFIQYALPNGRELLHTLPPATSTSRIEFTTAVVQTLQRHGLIDASFFQALLHERPRRADRVQRVADLWAAHAAPSTDRELGSTASEFFAAAGRSPREHSPTLLHVPLPARIAQSTPPKPADVLALQGVLSSGGRGYFLYRGELSAPVQEKLSRLRLRGHPIVPLSYAVMKTALADGDCAGVLENLEALHFDQQNLFEQHNAVRDERFFFGRGPLLTRLGSALARGDAIALTGLRKSGKTSVLNMLRHHLTEHPWCRVDLEGFDSEEDWPAVVFRELIAAYDRWGHTTFHDWPSQPEAPADKGALLDAMRRRRSWQRDRGSTKRPILVLDEAEHVFPLASETSAARQWRRAAGSLRDLAQTQEGRWLSILVADHRPVLTRINNLPGGRTNPFFRFLREEPVGLFSTAEVNEMVTTIGSAMGIRAVEVALVQELHAFTGGHPGFSRQLAASIYDQRADRHALTTIDLQAALRQLHRRGILSRFFEQTIWLSMSGAERDLVTWLHTRGSASYDDLIERAEPEVIADLIDQGIVREGERCTLSMTGFVAWLSWRVRRAAGQQGRG